jgi:streptomycin 6-kinase
MRPAMRRTVNVPDALRNKAIAGGPECMAWLGSLSDQLDDLEREWSIEIGDTLPGGTASFVANATRADGTPTIVKLAMPAAIDGQDALQREIRVLLAAGGRGCVRVLAHDFMRSAVLLERLGTQLADQGLPLPTQFAIICDTLHDLWAITDPVPGLPSGADKARWLGSFARSTWDELGRPCPQGMIDHAVRLADRRAEAFAPEHAVLVHGDAHGWNTLADPTAPGRYRLVDPDGLIAEPEYDLAIPMREHSEELLAGNPLDLGLRRARHLAGLTGLDAQKIWEWGYIERVTTGLYVIKLRKNIAGGHLMLDIAAAWAEA